MSKKVVLVWFRNDLRLHDNEVLSEAINKSDLIIPVYFFDPRYYSKNKFHNYKTGLKRAQFQLESVSHLKEKLQSMDSDLMTFVGKPEEILPKLCAKYEVMEVYHHREVASRETQISELVESALWENKINLRHFIGHTLFHKEDLPFPIKDIPDKFNIFRKKIERESSVRNPLDAPTSIQSPQHLEQTSIPSLQDLGFPEDEIIQMPKKDMEGGEDIAFEKLNTVLDPNYTGNENFSLISPYIAVGSLSPIFVYHRMQSSGLSQNKKRYDRLMTMLLWRDYFRFMLKKYPNIFFKPMGTKNNSTVDIPALTVNEELFEKWKSGQTDPDFINSTMIQLKKTGYIPYQAGLIAASYLVHEYQVNWLKGASWFEEQLLDYSPATVYGQWSHVAGVGTSEKDNKALDWQKLIKTNFPNGLPKLDELFAK